MFEVELVGRFLLCQVQGYRDSKYHPDCRKLKNLIRDILCNQLSKKPSYRDWFGLSMLAKGEAGKLYMPCLSKNEIEEIFASDRVLSSYRDMVWDNIQYWNDVRLIEDVHNLPDKEGEIFFEAKDGYWLRDYCAN